MSDSPDISSICYESSTEEDISESSPSPKKLKTDADLPPVKDNSHCPPCEATEANKNTINMQMYMPNLSYAQALEAEAVQFQHAMSAILEEQNRINDSLRRLISSRELQIYLFNMQRAIAEERQLANALAISITPPPSSEDSVHHDDS